MAQKFLQSRNTSYNEYSNRQQKHAVANIRPLDLKRLKQARDKTVVLFSKTSRQDLDDNLNSEHSINNLFSRREDKFSTDSAHMFQKPKDIYGN